MSAAVWTPTSTCGVHCLRDNEVPGVGRAVRTARLGALVLVLLAAAALVPVLPGGSAAGCGAPLRTGPSCASSASAGPSAAGCPARRALVVANHVSWLDILVILAAGGSRIVAKSQVREWPLVGRIAAGTGTFFLNRDRPSTASVHSGPCSDGAAAGDVVAVFPRVRPRVAGARLAGRVLPAAMDSGAWVVPLSLRFTAAGEPTTRAAFIGDDTMVESMSRVLALRG